MAKYKNTESVLEDAYTHTVTHNLDDSAAVVTKILPNWAARAYWVSKTVDTVVIGFAVPAPASALMDVVVETS